VLRGAFQMMNTTCVVPCWSVLVAPSVWGHCSEESNVAECPECDTRYNLYQVFLNLYQVFAILSKITLSSSGSASYGG
jgi:hypothetical protein